MTGYVENTFFSVSVEGGGPAGPGRSFGASSNRSTASDLIRSRDKRYQIVFAFICRKTL